MQLAPFYLLIITLVLSSCSLKPTTTPGTATTQKPTFSVPPQPIQIPTTKLDESLRFITILSTNDIHGGIESTAIKNKEGKTTDQLGGLAQLSGAVQAIRTANQIKHDLHGGVLLLDAGDQFQGTLISNYNEGALMFKAMDTVGYDAIVPGNHSYDFGPKGWLQDKVGPDTEDKNPRGVIEALAKNVRFPLLSANTFYRESLLSKDGTPVIVSGTACKPIDKDSAAIDWTQAKSPNFLTPFVIKNVAGVKVALIGIDNAQTSTTTTPENVTDLCFDDELASYKRVRQSLEGKADIFVMIIHNGNIAQESNISTLVTQLLAWKQGAVDVVIAGHTHATHNVNVEGVPILQSGAGGERFGRVDLIWDPKTAKIKKEETKSVAGIKLLAKACDSQLRQPASASKR
jgi:5'-nucleotidase